MKNKWILFAVAVILTAVNLLNADFSIYAQLSPADLAPVILLTVVILLLKTGVLSALLIGLKKLLAHIRKK